MAAGFWKIDQGATIEELRTAVLEKSMVIRNEVTQQYDIKTSADLMEPVKEPDQRNEHTPPKLET